MKNAVPEENVLEEIELLRKQLIATIRERFGNLNGLEVVISVNAPRGGDMERLAKKAGWPADGREGHVWYESELPPDGTTTLFLDEDGPEIGG